MLSKWAIENDFIIFSFLTKIILDDWKWFISRRPKMIFSGPFMANWKQSPLFMGNTKGFVLFPSDQNNFHYWRLLLLFFSKWSKTISMCMGNYKTICTNHGQLKMIYTIDELLLFIPKWLKTISTIHGNPKVICITHVQLKTIHIVDFLNNQKWSTSLIYFYLDQQKWFFTIHGQLKIISTTHE